MEPKRPRGIIVAIDGPVGAGKSTIARLVAQRLDYLYVDTGAMYRALAWKALHFGVNLHDREPLVEMCRATNIDLHHDPEGNLIVFADGEDVTEEIRRPEVSRAASLISTIPAVRRHLAHLQRHLGLEGGVVMEGRDIQTVIFPDAEVKVFLTASQDERVERRRAQLAERGTPVDAESVKHDLVTRDERDSSREVAPLKPAPDAVLLDTTNLGIEQVVERVLDVVAQVAPEEVSRARKSTD